MIDPECVNVFDLVVRRPTRTGPGGDTDPGSAPVIAGPLRCYFQRTNRVRKDRNGTDVVIEGLYLLDPFTAGGAVLDLRERDWLQHTLPTGRLTVLRAVQSVSYEHVGAEVDHIELEV